jgi:hypothetical protein
MSLLRVLLENDVYKVIESLTGGVISDDGKKYYEVFVNPTFNEIADIRKMNPDEYKDDIRFIIDCENLVLYVASYALLHSDIAFAIGNSFYFRYPGDRIICGEATIINTKLSYDSSSIDRIVYDFTDIVDSERIYEDIGYPLYLTCKQLFLEGKFKWLDNWFGNSFSEKMKYNIDRADKHIKIVLNGEAV